MGKVWLALKLYGTSSFFYLTRLISIQIFTEKHLFLICFFYLGVRFTSYHGNFMLRSTDLIALPAVDCDKAYAMQFALEETLLTTQIVYFQVALLYPSIRWIRFLISSFVVFLRFA